MVKKIGALALIIAIVFTVFEGAADVNDLSIKFSSSRYATPNSAQTSEIDERD